MTDRPILFSGAMVNALLAGRKTQTRRLLNPQPSAECVGFQRVFAQPPYFEAVDAGGKPIYAFPERDHSISPYPNIRFAVGDRLWVKETWQEVAEGYLTIFRADYPACVPAHFENVPALDALDTPWRPSIFMPRKKSRLTLTITEVRAQRLQKIDEDDARAEGVEMVAGRNYRGGYAVLWNSLHTEAGRRWDDDPCVVAVSFAVEQANIDGGAR